MPDNIARKRLKKKMLDRWENEGGKVSFEQTTAGKDLPTNHPSEGKQVSASHDNSTGIPASSIKRKKPTRK